MPTPDTPITIVDYGVGNIASVLNIGRKAGASMAVSSDPDTIAGAHKLILPGVGAFARGMSNLRERGLIAPLHRAVIERRIPILGLCLGMQLFTRRSEEGDAEGLGWIDAVTERFHCDTNGSQLKVPHMGWNRIEVAKADPLTTDLPADPRFYFVHSFFVECKDRSDVLLWSTHGNRFAAGIQRGNIRGVQFHPEKSHQYGLALMRGFASL